MDFNISVVAALLAAGLVAGCGGGGGGGNPAAPSPPGTAGTVSNTKLSPLAPIPSLVPWSTFNGNAAHNAYVPASFGPAGFTSRWDRLHTVSPAAPVSPTLSKPASLSAPAVDNGRVFTVAGATDGNSELAATSEASGDVLWRYEFGTQANASPPATANGKVFVTSGTPTGRFLWIFDQASGQLTSKTALPLPWTSSYAPTVVGDMVYLQSAGLHGLGGLLKLNAATGQVAWNNTSWTQSDGWTPSVDGRYAYAYIGNQLNALDIDNNGGSFQVLDQGIAWSTSPVRTPTLSGGMGFVIQDQRLVAFDLQARTRAWVAEGARQGQAVVAQDTVYSFGAAGEVEARAAATGLLQWKSPALALVPAPEGSGFDTAYAHMVATANLVFVSSATATLALDLATHQVVWNYPLGGELAISERGVLYIASPGGKLAAVNLR